MHELELEEVELPALDIEAAAPTKRSSRSCKVVKVACVALALAATSAGYVVYTYYCTRAQDEEADVVAV